MVNITFTWDDGAVEDIKLMNIAIKHNIPSLFFIPATNSERNVMPGQSIKAIAENNFEIGAHTYSHSYLTTLPLKKAHEEILNGKFFLEQLIGKEIPHFCFPGGHYNPDLIDITKEYFKTARTADTGVLVNEYKFLIRPTFQFYDRGKKSLIYHSFKSFSELSGLTIKNLFSTGYFNFVKDIIWDLNDRHGAHRIIIWGHSWEIEENNLWDILEDFFIWLNNKIPNSLKSYSDLIGCETSKSLS